jgi:hypothetical protein
MIVKCLICNKEENVPPSREKNYKTCSIECSKIYRKSLTNNNIICPICNIEFHCKPSKIKKHKNICCSLECSKKLKSILMKGEGNHQYGLKGELNSTFNNGIKINNYGYRLIYSPNHPFCNHAGYVLEHRLVAEKYLLTDITSIEINGNRYLKQKPKLAVHHKDFDKLNNDVNNLVILTKSAHSRLHALINPQPRDDDTGRFISREIIYNIDTLDFEINNNIINNKTYGENIFGSTGIQ